MKIVLKPLMAATAVGAMLASDAVTAKDKDREENQSPFKAYVGKLPDNDKLNNSYEKKVPGVKPETIEMEIIKGLSADIKVSEGVEKIQEPALSTCFASPFYLAEIEIGELVWRQKVSFARTNKGMVMIPKPGTEKKLPELLELLNPEFTLKTEEDGQSMLSALKAIYPSYVDDDFTPRMEKRGNQWVFIFDKFFKKLSGIAVVTDEQGRILRIGRSLSIQASPPKEPVSPGGGVGELEGATGTIAVSPGDLIKLKDKISLDGKYKSRAYSKLRSGKETVRLSIGRNAVQFETGATPEKANVRIKGSKKFVDGVISEVKDILGVKVELSRIKLIAETITYAGFLQSQLAVLDQEVAKTMTLRGKTKSGNQVVAVVFERGFNGVRLNYSEEKVSLTVKIEGNREFVDGIKSLLNKIKKTAPTKD